MRIRKIKFDSKADIAIQAKTIEVNIIQIIPTTTIIIMKTVLVDVKKIKNKRNKRKTVNTVLK